MVNQCTHLTEEEHTPLRLLLEKYKSLFNGMLGHWKDEQYDVGLKADAMPYHVQPYPIPRAYEIYTTHGSPETLQSRSTQKGQLLRMGGINIYYP